MYVATQYGLFFVFHTLDVSEESWLEGAESSETVSQWQDRGLADDIF
jgi:hypothetical protein